MKKEMNKKGISPLISTVMLIALVVIVATIIIVWSGGIIKEKTEKFGKAIDNVCLDVKLETYVNPDNTIGLRNKGIIPVQEVKLIVNENGNDVIHDIGADEGGRVGSGLSSTIETYSYSSGKEIKVIPVLIGRKSGILTKFTCPEQTGVNV